MRRKIDWLNVGSVTAGMLATFCLGLAAPGYVYGYWSLPTPSTSDLPAWLQAVGGLIGIGIAIYVPWRQRRNQILDAKQKDRLERDREAQLRQIMSIALFQPVETYRAHCAFLAPQLKRNRLERQSLPEILFDRAPEFDQFREKLPLMGQVGVDINKLIAHQDVVRGSYNDFRRLNDPLPKPLLDTLSNRLKYVETVAENIKDELRKALDPPVTD